MMRVLLSCTAAVAIAVASALLWPSLEARSASGPLGVYQSGTCTHDGKDYTIGETVCVEGQEYRCTTEGLVATGAAC